MQHVQALPTGDPESGIRQAGASRSLMRSGNQRWRTDQRRCLGLETHAGGEEEVETSQQSMRTTASKVQKTTVHTITNVSAVPTERSSSQVQTVVFERGRT